MSDARLVNYRHITEFSKIPHRSLQRLRHDFFEEIAARQFPALSILRCAITCSSLPSSISGTEDSNKSV